MPGEQPGTSLRRYTTSALTAACLFSATLQAAGDPAPIAPLLAHADAAVGEKVFLQCSICHVSNPGEPSTIGPNLWNLLGREVASQAAFAYSDSLKQVGGRWDFENLNRYLFDPKLLAPEGRMPFAGIKNEAERAHLIAYLRSLSDEPLPLPALAPEAPAEIESLATDEPNRWDGLPPGTGREEVYYQCRPCHSLMIVKQQGLSRSAWDETLNWMVAEQGMRPIADAATRERLLIYLSTHFGSE